MGKFQFSTGGTATDPSRRFIPVHPKLVAFPAKKSHHRALAGDNLFRDWDFENPPPPQFAFRAPAHLLGRLETDLSWGATIPAGHLHLSPAGGRHPVHLVPHLIEVGLDQHLHITLPVATVGLVHEGAVAEPPLFTTDLALEIQNFPGEFRFRPPKLPLPVTEIGAKGIEIQRNPVAVPTVSTLVPERGIKKRFFAAATRASHPNPGPATPPLDPQQFQAPLKNRFLNILFGNLHQ